MEIPAQEQKTKKWFKSHLLNDEIELQDLYELEQLDLDLLMAETAEIRSDVENRSRSYGRWCTAGYFLELARIIDRRRQDHEFLIELATPCVVGSAANNLVYGRSEASHESITNYPVSISPSQDHGPHRNDQRHR